MYLNKPEFMGPHVITVGLSLVDSNIWQNQVITYITVSMYSLVIHQHGLNAFFSYYPIKISTLINYTQPSVL